MKNHLFIFAAIFSFGFASAQTDSKSNPTKPVENKTKIDSLSPQDQLKKDTNLKESDAVKTQDHTKVTRQVSKDTLTTAKPKSTTGSKKKAKS